MKETDNVLRKLQIEFDSMKKTNEELQAKIFTIWTERDPMKLKEIYEEKLLTLNRESELLKQEKENFKRGTEQLNREREQFKQEKENFIRDTEQLNREREQFKQEQVRVIGMSRVTSHTSVIPVIYDDPTQNFSSILEELGQQTKVVLSYCTLETLPHSNGGTQFYFFSSPTGRFEEEMNHDRKRETEQRFGGPVKVFAFRYGTNPQLFSEIPSNKVHYQFVYNGQVFTPSCHLNDDNIRKLLTDFQSFKLDY